MSRFIVRTECALSLAGKVGAGLLVGGPLVAIASYWAMMSPPDWLSGNTTIGFSALMLIAVGAALVGLVLMLAGRSYVHEVEVLSEREKR